MNAIDIAVQSLGCSQSELAKKLGVHRSVITNWKLRGVPLKDVKRLSEVSGVPAHVLCPTYFPKPVEVLSKA